MPPGHVPIYFCVRLLTMRKQNDFVTYLGELISHGKDLHYKNEYGAAVKVIVQPLAKLDKLNADPINIKKLADCGVQHAVVIGCDEHGAPILLDCDSLKTYLLDPASTGKEYIKHSIIIAY